MGRLIDADELKRKVNKKRVVGRFNTIKLIDEAPTVELTEEQAIDKLHETGWLIRHDKEMAERPQGEPVVKCKDCKHQKKFWHEDKRMKEGGCWVYGCDFICDPFESTPVCGRPEEYCSSAEKKGGAE